MPEQSARYVSGIENGGRTVGSHGSLLRYERPGIIAPEGSISNAGPHHGGSVAMILMIDNYDSFTYNLVQYLGELGAEVVVRRNDAVTFEEIERLAPAAVVISPGPCTPNEAGISVP